jgi:hypothetical protein
LTSIALIWLSLLSNLSAVTKPKTCKRTHCFPEAGFLSPQSCGKTWAFCDVAVHACIGKLRRS